MRPTHDELHMARRGRLRLRSSAGSDALAIVPDQRVDDCEIGVCENRFGGMFDCRAQSAQVTEKWPSAAIALRVRESLRSVTFESSTRKVNCHDNHAAWRERAQLWRHQASGSCCMHLVLLQLLDLLLLLLCGFNCWRLVRVTRRRRARRLLLVAPRRGASRNRWCGAALLLAHCPAATLRYVASWI